MGGGSFNQMTAADRVLSRNNLGERLARPTTPRASSGPSQLFSSTLLGSRTVPTAFQDCLLVTGFHLLLCGLMCLTEAYEWVAVLSGLLWENRLVMHW